MSIDRSVIIQAATEENYRRGQDIFLAGSRIRDYACVPHAFSDMETVSALISDADGTDHETQVLVDEVSDRIVSSRCDCLEYQENEGLCRHCVALLLKHVSRRSLEKLNRRMSRGSRGQAAQDLISAYAGRDMQVSKSPDIWGMISLEPTLKAEGTRLYAAFRIGIDKKYVLKDLIEFARLMQNREFHSYGQKLAFCHEPEAFSPESVPMARFITDRIEEYICHFEYQQENTYSYHTLKALRYLPLSPQGAEQFLTLPGMDELFFEKDRQKSRLRIIEADPPLTLFLSRTESGGFELKTEDYYILPGTRNLWILTGKNLCHCSDAFSQTMRLFLERTARVPDHTLTLDKDQMPAFCGGVIRRLTPFAHTITEGFELEDYMPPAAAFSIYLDMPENDRIICRAYADYGGRRCLLTSPVNTEKGYRDSAAEQHLLQELRHYFSPDTEDDGEEVLSLTGDGAIFRFLQQGLPHIYSCGDVFVSERLKKVRVLDSPRTQIGISIKSGLLDLTISSGDLPEDELAGILSSYQRRLKYHRLKSGEFLNLESSSFNTLSELADGLRLTEKDLAGASVSLPLYRAAYVDAVLEEGRENIRTQRDKSFKALIREIKSVRDSDYEVPEHLKAVLRDYQKTGCRWLQTLTHLGFGGILADDMGLGKTLQVIALLSAAKKERAGRLLSLIVCPASLVFNWESEIARFSPDLKVLTITGPAGERQARLRDHEGIDVLVTSYDMLKRDIAAYEDLTFDFQIIDEAQYIKNHQTQAARSVRRIHARTRFALTGTPIENRLAELWSIFEYLMPGYLYSYRAFREELEQPITWDHDEIAAERLKKMIRPFILRRLKSDVLKELPPKLEKAIYTQMTVEQQKLYDANVRQLADSLAAQSDAAYKSSKIRVLAELMKLRQICCDPSLVYRGYHGGSAKLDACIDLIGRAMDGGHRILLFSQFTSMLDIIERRLKIARIDYLRLDGSTRSGDRLRMVSDFNNSDIPVFIISLKAGGTGLNLTGADIVIHYDPWWNVAAQNQAADRTHRIGQEKTVTVYKLISRGTIEEKILALQEAKQALADDIITADLSGSDLSREALIDILKA